LRGALLDVIDRKADAIGHLTTVSDAPFCAPFGWGDLKMFVIAFSLSAFPASALACCHTYALEKLVVPRPGPCRRLQSHEATTARRRTVGYPRNLSETRREVQCRHQPAGV
ncbi:MAG TPA: hypothetical protein VK327_17910, partial [Candidatus Paceibacterota bacterium]|nr:hypothetical protein [Candidatus Paceibacterota bacterium]